MPKRTGFLYEKMLDKAFIRQVIIKATENKRTRKDAQIVLGDIDRCTEHIYDILKNEEYVPSIPKHKQIYDKSGDKWREIQYVKLYPDGIIQWIIVETLKPIFMKHMWPWSCASIPGRGWIRQAGYLKRALKNDIPGTKYSLQADIRKYYPSIDKIILMRFLERKIKDPKMLKIVSDIIHTSDKGLGIGYYINQWLANFYLEKLDWYIASLPGIKYYCRYMDNLTILGPNKKLLHKARIRIVEYLTSMGLTLKDDWQVFPTKKRLVSSVGYRFGRGFVIMKKRNLLRISRQAKRIAKKQSVKKKIPACQATSFLSRIGQLCHCDCDKAKEKYISLVNIYDLKRTVCYESLGRCSTDQQILPG